MEGVITLNKRTELMTLCDTFLPRFEDTGSNTICRADEEQDIKDVCTFCNVRRGWDYILIPKERREQR